MRWTVYTYGRVWSLCDTFKCPLKHCICLWLSQLFSQLIFDVGDSRGRGNYLWHKLNQDRTVFIEKAGPFVTEERKATPGSCAHSNLSTKKVLSKNFFVSFYENVCPAAEHQTWRHDLCDFATFFLAPKVVWCCCLLQKAERLKNCIFHPCECDARAKADNSTSAFKGNTNAIVLKMN